MADTLLEVFKTIGALSGICAAGFLVWDRYTKHFPVAIIVPRPLSAGSRNIAHWLYVKNASDRPILIAWEYGNSNELRIAKSNSVHGVVQSMRYGETRISVDAAADVLLPVFKPGSYDDIDPDNGLELHLRWRFAQPRVWKIDRKIRVWIRKRDFDSMVDDYLPPSDQSE
jgi:hypothetical protein